MHVCVEFYCYAFVSIEIELGTSWFITLIYIAYQPFALDFGGHCYSSNT